LEFAKPVMKDTWEVVVMAIEQDAGALVYASETLQADQRMHVIYWTAKLRQEQEAVERARIAAELAEKLRLEEEARVAEEREKARAAAELKALVEASMLDDDDDDEME
jgi:hypothetical protein